MSVKKRRLVIAGKHLNEREDGKRKEKMRCKTICEIAMHGCAVRKRNMRKGSPCCCTVVHKQTGNVETSGRTHAPLILGSSSSRSSRPRFPGSAQCFDS